MNINQTYWASKGKHQLFADFLENFVPASGEVQDKRKNKALEKFRKASNCYYDLYNNGLRNFSRQATSVFGIRTSRFKNHDYPRAGKSAFYEKYYELVEKKMDEIILAAIDEVMTKHGEYLGQVFQGNQAA